MTSEMEKTADYLNQVYYRLELKRAELTHALFHRIFELESGFYNGHYSKREDGSFYMDYYPIPVISVKNYCDIVSLPDDVFLKPIVLNEDTMIDRLRQIIYTCSIGQCYCSISHKLEPAFSCMYYRI